MAGAALAAALVASCAPKVDLGRDLFVGEWRCGGETIALSVSTIETSAGTEKIAWIETAKNADYGLFTTKGARYSIFDQQKNSLTWHSHDSGATLACTRVA